MKDIPDGFYLKCLDAKAFLERNFPLHNEFGERLCSDSDILNVLKPKEDP